MLPKFAAFFMLLSLLFLEIGYIKDSNSMQTLKLEYDFLRCWVFNQKYKSFNENNLTKWT